MLSRADFENTMQKITDAHPRKTYSRDQVMRLFDQVKTLTGRQFNDAVTSLLDSDAFFPTIHKIIQACRPYIEKNRASKSAFSECSYCTGTGIAMFEPVDIFQGGQNPRFGVRCPFCDAASMRGLGSSFHPITKEAYLRRDKLAIKIAEMKRTRDSGYKMNRGEALAYARTLLNPEPKEAP